MGKLDQYQDAHYFYIKSLDRAARIEGMIQSLKKMGLEPSKPLDSAIQDLTHARDSFTPEIQEKLAEMRSLEKILSISEGYRLPYKEYKYTLIVNSYSPSAPKGVVEKIPS